MLSTKEQMREAYLIVLLEVWLLRQQKSIVEKRNTYLKSPFESDRLKFQMRSNLDTFPK